MYKIHKCIRLPSFQPSDIGISQIFLLGTRLGLQARRVAALSPDTSSLHLVMPSSATCVYTFFFLHLLVLKIFLAIRWFYDPKVTILGFSFLRLFGVILIDLDCFFLPSSDFTPAGCYWYDAYVVNFCFEFQGRFIFEDVPQFAICSKSNRSGKTGCNVTKPNLT